MIMSSDKKKRKYMKIIGATNTIEGNGKGILQVLDTGTSQVYDWWILEYFWCTNFDWKFDIYVL